MENQSPYLTLSEATHYSRTSVRQIQCYLKAGKLKRYGHGRKPLIKREVGSTSRTAADMEMFFGIVHHQDLMVGYAALNRKHPRCKFLTTLARCEGA